MWVGMSPKTTGPVAELLHGEALNAVTGKCFHGEEVAWKTKPTEKSMQISIIASVRRQVSPWRCAASNHSPNRGVDWAAASLPRRALAFPVLGFQMLLHQPPAQETVLGKV